jgi:hypothetical protein
MLSLDVFTFRLSAIDKSVIKYHVKHHKEDLKNV